MCPDVLGGSKSFVIGDGFHPLLAETLDGVGVLPQIELRADQNDRDVGSVVADLREPLQRMSVVMNATLHHLRRMAFKGEPCAKLWPERQNMRTLALTLSNDGGLTMEKQMRKTSVWG